MTGKTKHPIPAWAGCLLLIGLTVFGTLKKLVSRYHLVLFTANNI